MAAPKALIKATSVLRDACSDAAKYSSEAVIPVLLSAGRQDIVDGLTARIQRVHDAASALAGAIMAATRPRNRGK